VRADTEDPAGAPTVTTTDLQVDDEVVLVAVHSRTVVDGVSRGTR